MNTTYLTGKNWSTEDAPEYRQRKKPYRVLVSGTIPPTTYVTTKKDAMATLRLAASHEHFGIDTEFDEHGRLVTWQFSDGSQRVVVDHESATKYYRSWLKDPAVKKVFHHAYADLPILEANKVDVQGFYADTLVLDWLVDENRRRHGLKVCAFDWLGIPLTEFGDAFGVVPKGKKKPVVPSLLESYKNNRERFLEYSSLDAYATFWLFAHHKAVLEKLKAYPADIHSSKWTKVKTNLWGYYRKYDVDFTMTLVEMAKRGMRIDVQVLNEIGEALDHTMDRVRHVFRIYAPDIAVYRVKLGQPYLEIIKGEDISLSSTQQLSTLFYDTLGCDTVHKLKDGTLDGTCRSTDEKHLSAWADNGNIFARLLLAYRRAATQRGTFVGEPGKKGLLAHVQEGKRGAVINTELKQIGTVTGRIASKAPNLQNIPNRKEKDPYRMRRAFTAREGCKLIVADYSMFELRVMAHLSRDKKMCAALIGGRDLHSTTAKNVFDLPCDLDEVKTLYPDLRSFAKQINFGLQYGMQAALLADKIEATKEEAQKYIDAYFQLYSGVYYWIRRTIEQCRKNGFVTTVLGRRRRIPDINIRGDDSRSYGLRKHAENQAMNMPIQGSVADIIKIAMNRIEADEDLKRWEARLLMQVHDELIVEAPWITAEQVRERVVEIMETSYELRVPTVVDAAIGDNWEEAKD